MSTLPSIRAKMYLLPTEEGGRQSPIRSGYRPPIFVGSDHSSAYDAVIEIEGRDEASPGEECHVRIRFLHPEFLRDTVKAGVSFEVWDGRVIARGSFIEARQ